MTSFEETFDGYANGTIDTVSSSAWLSLDSTYTYPGGVKVSQKCATNTGTEQALCVYQTTRPATKVQEAAAWITSAEEGAAAWVEIGVSAATFQGGYPASWATRVLGVYARLHWNSDGVRTLSVRHKLRNGSDTELGSVDLVTAGGVEASGYEGGMKDAGAVNVMQHLRLIVTEEDYGLGVRAYVNEPDDDRPTLFRELGSDFVTPTASATDYGAWWFGFGSASASDKLYVFWAYGADYDLSEDRQPQVLRADQVRLAELIDRVKMRYDRSAKSDTRNDEITQAVNDEIHQIMLEVGDVATFMRREDSVAITPNDRREVTLTAHMNRVLGMREAETGSDVWFRFLRQDAQGAPVVQVENRANRTVLVDYLLRFTELATDDDVCPIPREHTELVVIGACLRLAEVDRIESLQRTFLARRQVLLGNLKRDVNRNEDQRRTRMDPRPPRMIYRRGGYLSRWMT